MYRHVLLEQIEPTCNVWAWPYHFMGVFSCLSAIRRQFCIEKSRWEFEFCPLSGIKKRPLLGGCFSITTMLISIRNTELVRCREVVRFSEGPLSEARLYLLSVSSSRTLISTSTNVSFCTNTERRNSDTTYLMVTLLNNV